MKSLPIHDVLDDIKNTLNTHATMILQAPPGAGKSTLVPISLLKQAWLKDKMIIMLEPRRVAARMVATKMAKTLGEEVGQSVGYQVRMERCYSKKTKLLVVTEAILVRMLQSKQDLEEVGMVIFDEFHERSIHTDLSLALCLQVQELLREDLKLLIMSATLNSKALQNLLGEVPVVSSHGKTHEVQNIYLQANVKQPDRKNIHTVLLHTTLNAFKEEQGDILIFLAGIKEINTLQTLLQAQLQNEEVEILPLYSALSKAQQDRAIMPLAKRKIILATNIAQTSLTIEGVKVVIDSGLEKLAFYDNAHAMNHLHLGFISNDSAVQRAGRAGRLSSGKCFRLWHKGKLLQDTSKPEILRTDLSSFFLELALWGVKDMQELAFLDVPDKQVQRSSKTLLKELKMVNEKHEITPMGKKALTLGVHPRFAFMILKANELGYAYEACLLCACLSEKDIFKNSYRDCNIHTRFMHLYEKEFDKSFININHAKTVLKQAQFFYTKLKGIDTIKKSDTKIDAEHLGVLLLFAYPDRLAKQRQSNEQRYKLSNGKGAVLNFEDPLFNAPFLIVPVLNAQTKDSNIQWALQISLFTIQKWFSADIFIKDSITYNKESKRFDLREKAFFHELELYAKPLSADAKHDFTTPLLELIKQEGLGLFSWSKKAVDLKNRVNFVHEHTQNEMPLFTQEALLESVDSWLTCYLHGITTLKALEALDMHEILLGTLSWEAQQQLDTLAPTHIKVPSGSNIKIDYSNPQTAVLAVKIQEVFGLQETPKVLNNTHPLQMHLLTPALRPIQITYDLKSFWENSYEEVRKELFSKYKKHYWPQNPFEAVATNRTKKSMKQ